MRLREDAGRPQGVSRGVPPGDPPLWSVMIPTYNCADYLRDALASVLVQDPGSHQMQITVVDDSSTRDDPAAVVREVAGDRVQLVRNNQNLGATATFNRCIALAEGSLIHILHGDDAVREGFYRTLQLAFEAEPGIGAAFCRVLDIDEAGMWRSLDLPLQPKAGVIHEFWRYSAVMQKITFPGMVLRAEAVAVVGGFDQRLSHAADWELWTRIALHYPIWYEPTPLALYRVHSRSDTSALRRNARDVEDVRRAIQVISSQLPPSERNVLRKRALHAVAARTLSRAWESRDSSGDLRAWWVQLRAAVACSPTPPVLLRALHQVMGAGRQACRSWFASRPRVGERDRHGQPPG